jgi:minor extracellular serine protease Vpr
MLIRTLRRALAVAASVTLALSFGPQAVASPVVQPAAPTTPSAAPKLPKDAKTVTGRWIVQVSGAATAEGGTSSAAKASQDQVLREAGSEGLTVGRTASFTSVYNGMTVTATDADADQLRDVAGVVGVWPVLQVAAPNPATSTSTKDLTSALAMTGADIAYSELGYTGQGIKVGVIDTGIDIDHPDLGGTGTPGTTPFPSSRVKWGYDFVGDAYDEGGSSPAVLTPAPDANPDDCMGHGTHVAGIIGANGDFATGGVRGVAPKVTFGAYRVFGCDGSTSTDIVLAAMDKAISDHMDVVNMSLGDSYMSWPSYPTSVAAQTMQKAGVILVASAGNEGADGVFTTGSPSVSDGAISVAAFENAHSFTTSTGSSVPYLTVGDAPGAPTSGSAELALAGPDGDGTANTACTQISSDVADKVALVSRGTCTFYEKAMNAQKAGATAVVIYNNAPGLATVGAVGAAGAPTITIPVVLIRLADGTALAASLQSGAVSLTWTAGWITTPNPTAGLVSDVSSYGLAADLSLKPDLGAPGVNILSTYPIEKGSYATESGTSMASAHVTGAVALLLQAKPELKGKTTKVRELLQTTGALAASSQDPMSGALEPVHHQGGGLIQIATALTTEQTVSPGKISLGEGTAGPKTTSITLTNTSNKPVTYTITKSDGVATLGSLISDSFFRNASATMSAPKTVTVPAKGKATVKVKITPSSKPATAIYGGWVTFTAAGATTLHVPFAGMVGDYQSVKVLTGDGLPTLAQLDATGNLAPVSGHPVYTMQNFDYPFVLLHLDYPVSDLRLDIFRVGWRGFLTPIAPNYRSWVKTGPAGKDPSYQYFYFDGSYTTLGAKGKQFPIQNGTYVITITVTKALASGHSRGNYETWTSPTFSITQPT